MRKSVILAMIAVVTPVTVGAEPIYAVYTVLPDHAACSGPGHIAYVATLDVNLDEAGFLRSDKDLLACSILERKGGILREMPVPCGKEAGRKIGPDEAWTGFCKLTQELRPIEISLKGSLTGCITVTGHAFIDGTWTATTVRPNGTRSLSGKYDDPRLEASYNPSSTGKQGWLEPTLSVWLRLEDEAVVTLPDTAVEVAAAAVGLNVLRLVDGPRPGCAENPASCWKPPEADANAKVSLVNEETWSVCEADGSGLKFGIGRDVPVETGN